MARINSNIPSVIAQRNLIDSNKDLETALERLSTGLRINRGKDDPAGLIISERLRSDISGAQQAITNAERASSVIATTEAALAEVSDLLLSIKELIVEAANTGANSIEERNANQLQIDSAIDSITRISNTATFGGLTLLNGSLDYTLSGINPSAIDQARINNASFVGQTNVGVEVDVIASAQVGSLYFNGGAGTPTGVILSTVELEIAGPRGVQVVTFPSGTGLDTVANAINNLTATTGVEASLINGNVNSGLTFSSEGYGQSEFVSVRRLNSPENPADDGFTLVKFDDTVELPDVSGGFPWSDPSLTTATRDAGRDVAALVNGTLASGRGLEIKLNTTQLGLDLTLDASFATDPSAAVTSFNITGSGALFQVGPEVSALQQVNLGIPSVAASRLGGTTVGGAQEFLSSLKTGGPNDIATMVNRSDFTNAQDVLDKAIDEVAVARGRLGAFERNVLDPNVRSLQSSVENLSASNSIIRDADFAFETSELTRAQVLASAGTSVLQLANQQSQQVLQLLG